MENKLRSALAWAQENNYIFSRRFNFDKNIDAVSAILLQNDKSRTALDEACTLLDCDRVSLRALAYGWDGSTPSELTAAKSESAQGQAYALAKQLALEFIEMKKGERWEYKGEHNNYIISVLYDAYSDKTVYGKIIVVFKLREDSIHYIGKKCLLKITDPTGWKHLHNQNTLESSL